MCFRERRGSRGGEELELGHGQPPAGDPGAAEVTEAAPRSAGVRPGGRAAQCACAAACGFPPALVCAPSSARVKVLCPETLIPWSPHVLSSGRRSARRSHHGEDQPVPFVGFAAPCLWAAASSVAGMDVVIVDKGRWLVSLCVSLHHFRGVSCLAFLPLQPHFFF